MNLYSPSRIPLQYPLSYHLLDAKPDLSKYYVQVQHRGLLAYGVLNKELTNCGSIWLGTGEQYTQLPHIEQYLMESSKLIKTPCVFIFYVVSYLDAEPYIILTDVLPYFYFCKGKSKTTFNTRQRMLYMMFDVLPEVPYVTMTQDFYAQDEKHLLKLAKTAVLNGNEGVVLKKIEGLWEAGARNSDVVSLACHS